MRRNLIAAIDVGSHAIRMKIGEINKAGVFRELEKFRKIAVLGHDTFKTEKVSFESVDKACDILLDFRKTMDDYGVKNYEVMATSALREASNRDYILDQIKLKTGFKLNVIDNAEEQFLTLKAIKYKLNNYDAIIQEGAVIVVIGAGSIQITTYRQGELKSSQNVKMGALRVKELIGSLESKTLRFYRLLNEYIKVNLEGLDFFESDKVYEHLVVVGGEIGIISQLIEGEVKEDVQILKKKQFKGLLDELMEKSTEEIKQQYDVKRERAEILVPSMLLFKQFIEQTTSKEIIIPNISLADGIIRYIHEDLYQLRIDNEMVKDIVTNAVVLAKRFNYNRPHSLKVECSAMMLFDKLKKVHGLKEERILLQVACILHDIGRFISLDSHSKHSYDLIRSLELHGMSRMDMEMIANIARYHSMGVPKEKDENYHNLPTKSKIIVAKLVALIRIADSLDRSHEQKIELVSVKVKDKKVLIRGRSKVNTVLEEWNFSRKSEFFKEVFGLTPLLTVTKEI